MAMHYAKKVNRGEKVNLNLCPQNVFATEQKTLYHPSKQKWTGNLLQELLSLY